MHSGDYDPYDSWFCDPCSLPYAILPHDVPEVSTFKTPVRATPVGFNFNSTGRPSLFETPAGLIINSSGRPSYTPPRPGRRGLFARIRRRLTTINPRVVRRILFSDSESDIPQSQAPPSTPEATSARPHATPARPHATPTTPQAPPATPHSQQPSPQDSQQSPEASQSSPDSSPISTPTESPQNDSFDYEFFDSTKIEDYQAAVSGNRIMLKEQHPWRKMYKNMVTEMRSKKKPSREYYAYRFPLNPKCITPKQTKPKKPVSCVSLRPESSKNIPPPQKKKSALDLPLRI